MRHTSLAAKVRVVLSRPYTVAGLAVVVKERTAAGAYSSVAELEIVAVKTAAPTKDRRETPAIYNFSFSGRLCVAAWLMFKGRLSDIIVAVQTHERTTGFKLLRGPGAHKLAFR